jgi:hypothetical protein
MSCLCVVREGSEDPSFFPSKHPTPIFLAESLAYDPALRLVCPQAHPLGLGWQNPFIGIEIAESAIRSCFFRGITPALVLSIGSFGLTEGPAWTVQRVHNHSLVAPRIGPVIAPTNRALDHKNSAGAGRTLARTAWVVKLADRWCRSCP